MNDRHDTLRALLRGLTGWWTRCRASALDLCGGPHKVPPMLRSGELAQQGLLHAGVLQPQLFACIPMLYDREQMPAAATAAWIVADRPVNPEFAAYCAKLVVYATLFTGTPGQLRMRYIGQLWQCDCCSGS
jgi:hypothetical protein